MAERKLSILVQAIGAAKTAKDLKGVDRAISSIGARAGRGFRTAADNLQRFGVVAAGVAAAGLVAAVKVAADFESQLNTINTIARATPEGLKAIGDQIRSIARETGTPLEQLTQGYYDLLSAGIKAADAPKVLAEANKLAIGGLASAAETVDLLTTAINVYGGDASKAARFTDEFAKAIERGKVTAAELAGSYAMVAPLAKSLGIENKELAAGYARLTAAGTPAAEAATQMASAMTALLKKTPDLAKLERSTRKNYAAIAGAQGFNAALEQMQVDANKAGIDLVKLVGRKEALLYILQTTGPNLKAYNADLAAMGDAAGTAAGQMAERQKGLNFQLSRLKALALDAGITVGSKLLPKLTPLVERAVKFLNEHQPDLDRFADALAGAFDKAGTFAERIPWGQIGAGLQIAADWAGKLMGVFANLPPEVQTTLIALAGLNKLSGGAISGIVGELGKGLIKGVLGMNAGVVNINAGVVNGGGPGAPVPGGGRSLIIGGAAVAAIGVGVAASIQSAMAIHDERQQMRTDLGLSNAEALALQLSRATAADRRTALMRGAGTEFARENTTYAQALAAAYAKMSGGSNRGGERAYLAEIADNTAALRKQWTTALDRAGVTKRGKPGATESAVSATLLRDAAKRLGSGQRDLKVGMLDLIHAVRTWTPPAPKITVPVYVTSTVSVREVNVAQRVTARYGNSNRIYEG